MKIAVIGPGSMGLLYASGLAQTSEVILLGNNPENINLINQHGITVQRGESSCCRKVPAFLNGTYKEPVDLVILFTKAYHTQEALQANQCVIGPHTVILSLQNGAGHETTMARFADDKHILIGTTAQGASRKNPHTIVHSGLGDTSIGAVSPDNSNVDTFVNVFNQSGFPCIKSDNIRQTVWNKLMINASSSVLSGLLQVKQGYVATNPHAWAICQQLISEICLTANAIGCQFSAKEQIDRIYNHLLAAPDGLTSIYSDIRNGRKTEVDVISGTVVNVAGQHNLSVPTEQLMVRMVHALEGRNAVSKV
ncbi:MAG: 2-dehydropantoate 2-reductase [Paludibacteraceae bacterium]|nr:2-dehydropantoate 2-reductase [Paludibacteraceae bacterium]